MDDVKNKAPGGNRGLEDQHFSSTYDTENSSTAVASIQVPAALKALPAWLVWRYEEGGAKPRKIPYYVSGGRRSGVQGSGDDRKRLVSFERALAALASGGYTGLGFAMLPDWGLIGLDFDDCVAPNGTVHPDVLRIVESTYAEYSPSRRGVRAFVRGTLQDKKSRAEDGEFGFETFHAKGFLTVTGNILPGWDLVGNADVIAPLNAAGEALYCRRFGTTSAASKAPLSEGGQSDPLMTYEPPIGLSLEELKGLVQKLNPNCAYEAWTKVGMACHHETQGSDEGFAIWDEWSSAGNTYPGSEALQQKWASFGRQGGKPITARWIRREVGAKTNPQVSILDAKDFMASARAVIERHFRTDDGSRLVRTRGLWYEHAGPCYAEKVDESLRTLVWNFLDGARKHAKDGGVEPFKPTMNQVTSCIDALKAVARVEGAEPPCWLAECSGPDARELISLTNGLLHVPSRQLIPHSPGFFTLNTLPYPWDTTESPIEWLKFLDQVWPGDSETQRTLQEIFGYLLTADTSQQKMFLIIGPKRSGKGTIGRVLSALVGRNNVANPTLASLTGQFGMQPLIDKLVALVPDARVGAQANTQAIVERLLMVSGEDAVTIDRKHTSSWTGSMTARFVFLTNETPQLGDASGALAGRFITLEMGQSFFGREDPGLTARLLRELPAIFRWALEGRDRLKERGYFVQPEGGLQAADELAEINSPIASFVAEVCDVGAAYQVDVRHLYTAWRGWCQRNGRDHIGTVQTFGKSLRASNPGIQTSRPRVDGVQERHYAGIRIKPEIFSVLVGNNEFESC